MSFLSVKNASVDIPIFNAGNQSLKSVMLDVASFGRLSTNRNGVVNVSALKNINIDLGAGERLGLIGGNGAGKSTLLRLLAGVYQPTTGEICSSGNASSLIDISLGINDEATGLENIMLRGAILGMSRSEIKNKVDEIVDFAELGDFIHMPLRTYSSGMHLRLAFSISTMIEPKILIMDEWLSVGDENFRKKADARMNDLIGRTEIVILASHSRDLIETNCTRVIWLENGEIKSDSDPSTVCKQYFG